MIKNLGLIPRRANLSRPAFREYYEQRHAPLALQHLRSFRRYVRNHVVAATPADPPFDALSEFWYDGVAAVARRFHAGVVLLFAGAARTRGPFHLTMDTNDAIETAHAFPDALIVPLHYEGWAHFTQNRDDLEKAFEALGLGSRLRLLEAGVATVIMPK